MKTSEEMGITCCPPGDRQPTIDSIAPSCHIKDPAIRRASAKWLKDNFYCHIRQVNELKTGYELVFKYPDESLMQVIMDVFRQETECCPSFSLALLVGPLKETVTFQYFGSESIKAELTEALTFLGVLKSTQTKNG